ncbi:28S ribosomal protein S24 [Mactra antiquata]
MAALIPLRKCCQTISIPYIASRGIQTSVILQKKNVRAGVYKISTKKNVPLTYEEAKAPYKLGVEKSWNTWNTTNLKDEGRKSETLIEDEFIRNFMMGTWHRMIVSDIVIKRKHNMINIAFYVNRRRSLAISKVYFLVGYTEELLSCLLKCPVKLEIQSVESDKDMIFKYI